LCNGNSKNFFECALKKSYTPNSKPMVGAICTGTRTTPVKFCDDGSGSSTGTPAVVEECDKPVKGSVKLEKYPQGRVIVYNGSKWVTFTRNWFIYKENDYGAQMICK
jgi:hypothetical protein